MKSIDKKIEILRLTIPHIEPKAALNMHDHGAIIIDVRECSEVSDGLPSGAIHIQRGFIDLSIEIDIPDYNQQILLICEKGIRSLLAADEIIRLGYCNVACIHGGFKKWVSQGLPFTKKASE
jgi:sulfur-carrier protein adenylyltransferase/sulfurtransferase